MKVSTASGVGPDSGPGDTQSLPLPTCIKNPTPGRHSTKSGAGPGSDTYLPRMLTAVTKYHY